MASTGSYCWSNFLKNAFLHHLLAQICSDFLKNSLFSKTHFVPQNTFFAQKCLGLRGCFFVTLHICSEALHVPVQWVPLQSLGFIWFQRRGARAQTLHGNMFSQKHIVCSEMLGTFFCVHVSKLYSITRASAGNASVNSCCHMVSCQTKVQEHERKHGIHALLCSKRFGFCCGSWPKPYMWYCSVCRWTLG